MPTTNFPDGIWSPTLGRVDAPLRLRSSLTPPTDPVDGEIWWEVSDDGTTVTLSHKFKYGGVIRTISEVTYEV